MSVQGHFQLAKKLVRLLDSQFEILGVRFGLDPVIDLIPVVGNWITTVTSCYLFYIAYLLKVPAWVYVRMLMQIGLDYIISAIPLVGNIADVFYKSNEKNLALLSQFLDGEVLTGKVLEDSSV